MSTEEIAEMLHGQHPDVVAPEVAPQVATLRTRRSSSDWITAYSGFMTPYSTSEEESDDDGYTVLP